jgi:hypothetical protein
MASGTHRRGAASHRPRALFSATWNHRSDTTDWVALFFPSSSVVEWVVANSFIFPVCFAARADVAGKRRSTVRCRPKTALRTSVELAPTGPPDAMKFHGLRKPETLPGVLEGHRVKNAAIEKADSDR